MQLTNLLNYKFTTNKLNLVWYYRKSTKFYLELTKELEEMIIGLMLGGLFAEKISFNSNTRLQFKQSSKNKEYIDHLYSLFKEYCGSEPKVFSYFDHRPNKNKSYFSIKFSTYSLPCFNKFRFLFYNDEGVKIISDNLESLLTARGLAYWLMDDGYKSGNGFYFCTESYTLNENLKLAEILKNQFNLNCGVHKHTNGYRLYINSSSQKDLLQLVKPYLISHFYHKLDYN